MRTAFNAWSLLTKPSGACARMPGLAMSNAIVRNRTRTLTLFSYSPMSTENLDHLLDRTRQGIHFFSCVVESERRARCGRHLETLHHRLCAVMAGTHCNTLLIENRADVVRVDFVDHKGKHA